MTVVVRASGRSTVRCPYCLDALGQHVRCPTCATPIHAECRVEAGRCTTFGCTGRRPAALRPPLPLPWLGDGALRDLVAHLLALPAALVVLLACLVAGSLAAAALHPLLSVPTFFGSVWISASTGNRVLAWLKAEGGP